MTMPLLESSVKIAVIVLLALALLPLLRHRPAALRHWVLSMALLCAAATPVLQLIIPAWQTPLSTSWPASRLEQPQVDVEALRPERSVSMAEDVVARQADASDVGPRATTAGLLVATWITGMCIVLSILVAGGVRLARIASRAQRITDNKWTDVADRVARTYGLRRPVVLLESADPPLLVTWGVLQPRVMLPAGARDWSADRIRVVLYHELAHIRRGDWMMQLAAEVLRAAQWFNPFVWIACTRLRHESEHACDDAVLGHGVDGSEYATHLVEIARGLGRRRIWSPAPAISHSSSLERRVKAMLDHRVNRRPISRTARGMSLVVVLSIALVVAAVGAAQTTFSTLSGAVVDSTNGALPAVTLTLTNATTNAKYELQTDRTGRYEFVGLPPGEYLLETRLPGFAKFEGRVTVAGQNRQQDLVLQVGSLEENVTVIGGPADDNAPRTTDPDRQRLLEEVRVKRERSRCPAGTPVAQVGGIGGNLRAPWKIKDVKPRYPASLRDTQMQGSVVLHGRISEDGLIEKLDVLSSPHPDFAVAATEAVSQWQFDSTLLNCVPVAVDMTVTVNFKYQP